MLTLISITLIVDRKQRQERFRFHEELKKHGICEAFQNIQEARIDARYREAKQEIRILTTWIPDWNPLPRPLAEAIRRGVPTKILLLNPKSEMGKCRVRTSQYIQDTSPINSLERFINALRRADIQTEGNLEIRLYDTLPPFYMRMIDDWMIVGFYWHKYGSSQGPLFTVNGQFTTFGLSILDTFDSIWEDSKVLSPGIAQISTEQH